ncbi:MAG: ABC transporter permease [Burkholderiaceae bacterium]
MSVVLQPFAMLFRRRLLLVQTVRQEIRKRYLGSVLGLAWLVVHPLLFLGVYAAVYLLIFKVRFQLFDSSEYVLLIFCGLVPFLGIAEALGAGVPSVVADSSLVKNTLFPVELVPIKVLLASQGLQVVGTLILIVAIGLVRGLSPTMLFVPVIWFAQLLFMAGMLWFLAGLNVFFRDLQMIVGTLILLLMLISPIAYTLDMVPANLRVIVAFNPLSHFIFCYQSLLMLGTWPDPRNLAFVLVSGPVLFIAGHWFFMRLKRVLVDNV